MLLREATNGWLAVTQPAHALVAGQLAAAWGADWTAPIEPRDGVVTGAALHDIGWLDWEAAPTLNPQTGLPHTFLELPIATHIAMWRRASTLALAFGRYPALLTSLHGTRLYGSRDLSRLAPTDAALVGRFLSEERRRQDAWVASFQHDPTTAGRVDPATLARNSQYVALWDAMSLAICGGARAERSFPDVPTIDGSPRLLTLRPAPDGHAVVVEPWPFASAATHVTFDARLILDRCDGEVAMRDALANAQWLTISVRLAPHDDSLR